MAVIGDSPMVLINVVADMFNGLGGGSPYFIGIIAFCILVYLALHFRLDRGALVLLALSFIGAFYALNILPATVFYATILIVAIVAAVGILNASRQGGR